MLTSKAKRSIAGSLAQSQGAKNMMGRARGAGSGQVWLHRMQNKRTTGSSGYSKGKSRAGLIARVVIVACAFPIASMGGEAKAATMPLDRCNTWHDASSSLTNIATLNERIDKARVVDGNELTTQDAFKAVFAAFTHLGSSHSSKTAVIVRGGNFSGWDFANLLNEQANICFYQSNLIDTNWDDGTYFGLSFVDSDLSHASFENAQLPKVRFVNSSLRNVTMRRAQLLDGRFEGSWNSSVANWNLSGAVMTGFRFECGITISDGCPLKRGGISFVGASLVDADISTFLTWGDANFTGALFERTKIAPRQISDLIGIKIETAILLRGDDRHIRLSSDEFYRLQAAAKDHATTISEPSFRCLNARTTVEKIICSEYRDDLRALDRKMARLFMEVYKLAPGTVSAQKQWIRYRNRCTSAGCLIQAYSERIEVMLGMKENPLFSKKESPRTSSPTQSACRVISSGPNYIARLRQHWPEHPECRPGSPKKRTEPTRS